MKSSKTKKLKEMIERIVEEKLHKDAISIDELTPDQKKRMDEFTDYFGFPPPDHIRGTDGYAFYFIYDSVSFSDIDDIKIRKMQELGVISIYEPYPGTGGIAALLKMND